jgi:acyl-CoA thioesterase-1
MVSSWSALGAARRAAAAGLIAAGMVWTGAAQAASAGFLPNCRVSDVYLRLPADIARTERLVDRNGPLRILIVGPSLDGPAFSARKRERLVQALERRLPGVPVEITDDGRGNGLAANDFERIRTEVGRAAPDLVVWQVGTPDALAAIDPEQFGATLVAAAEWLKSQNVDLVLIDPPFVPNVDHEKLFWRIVGKIGEVSDRSRVNLIRRYAATQQMAQQRAADATSEPRPTCMSDLVAEAITRAVTR